MIGPRLRDPHGVIHGRGEDGTWGSAYTWCERTLHRLATLYDAQDLVAVDDVDTPITCVACLGTAQGDPRQWAL